MLRKLMLSALVLVCTLTIAGCSCEHVWKDATCTTPKTCESCGEIEGEPIAHDFADATCTVPKTCKDCGITEGSTAEHTWIDATCAAPKTCDVCSTTEGDLGDHIWLDATYTVPKTCELCSITEGDLLVRTDYSRDAFYDSNACYEISNLIHGVMPEGMTYTVSYAEFGSHCWSIYFTSPAGLKESYAQDVESWKQFKNELVKLSADAQTAFIKDGFIMDFEIFVLDNPDPNISKSLQKDKNMLEMKNGEILSDYLANASSTAVPFLESASYIGVHDLIMDSYAAYDPSFELTNQILYVYFHAPDGTGLALNNPSEQAKKDWKTTTDSLTEMSYIATTLFTAEGYEVLCAIMYLDDVYPDQALFACIGGQVLFDTLG